MNQKLVPYAFAVGAMIFALALVQCGHSIYDHFANGTEETVSALLFGAFAITGYLGYLLAAISVDFALRGDFYRNSHNTTACRYELHRVATVLLAVSVMHLFFFEAKDRAIVSGLTGVMLFLYSMRIRQRQQNHHYDSAKWFKIF